MVSIHGVAAIQGTNFPGPSAGVTTKYAFVMKSPKDADGQLGRKQTLSWKGVDEIKV